MLRPNAQHTSANSKRRRANHKTDKNPCNNGRVVAALVSAPPTHQTNRQIANMQDDDSLDDFSPPKEPPKEPKKRKIVKKLTKQLGRVPTADEIAKAKNAKKKKEHIELKDFEKRFYDLLDQKQDVSKIPDNMQHRVPLSWTDGCFDKNLGPSVAAIKLANPDASDDYIWKHKRRTFLRDNVSLFIRKHFDDLEVIAADNRSRRFYHNDHFMLDAFYGSRHPIRLPISKLTTILQMCLNNTLEKPSTDSDLHVSTEHRRHFLSSYAREKNLKTAIIRYVTSKCCLHAGNDLRIVGSLATKFYKFYNEWKQIDKSPTTLFKQYVTNCEHLQDTYIKQVKMFDDKIVKLKKKFVKQFRTGDVISFFANNLRRYAIIERNRDGSVYLYYFKNCDDDAFPHIFNVTKKSFLSDFAKWETDYLKKLNCEKNGPKAKLPDDQGWEYSSLWKSCYSKDFSVEPTTSLAHCKVDQLSFLQDPLDHMKSHVCKIAKKHPAFLTVTSSNSEIVKIQNPFFLFLNVRKGVVKDLPVYIIDKIKLLPPDIINEIVTYHHNYFGCLDFLKHYHRIQPVLNTFSVMCKMFARDDLEDIRYGLNPLPGVLHGFLNKITSTCNASYLQTIKKYTTSEEEHHKISVNFHAAEGVQILWRGQMPKIYPIHTVKPAVLSETPEAVVAFQFLQSICKEPINFFVTDGGKFDINAPASGFTSAKRFYLKLTWSYDCPIRYLDLFVFEIRIPDISTVELGSKIPITQQFFMMENIKRIILSELTRFFHAVKNLCNASVKNQKIKGIFTTPRITASDEDNNNNPLPLSKLGFIV